MRSIGLVGLSAKVSDFVFGVCAFFAVLLVERFVSPLLVALLVAGRRHRMDQTSRPCSVPDCARLTVPLAIQCRDGGQRWYLRGDFGLAATELSGFRPSCTARSRQRRSCSFLISRLIAVLGNPLRDPDRADRSRIPVALSMAQTSSAVRDRACMSDASRPIMTGIDVAAVDDLAYARNTGWEALWKGDYDQSITEFSWCLAPHSKRRASARRTQQRILVQGQIRSVDR